MRESTPRDLWCLGRTIAPIYKGEEVEFSNVDKYQHRTPLVELILPAIRLRAMRINELLRDDKDQLSKEEKNIIFDEQSFESEV